MAPDEPAGLAFREAFEEFVFSAGGDFYFRIIRHGHGTALTLIVASDTGQIDQMGIMDAVEMMLRQQFLEFLKGFRDGEFPAAGEEQGRIVDMAFAADDLVDRNIKQLFHGGNANALGQGRAGF